MPDTETGTKRGEEAKEREKWNLGVQSSLAFIYFVLIYHPVLLFCINTLLCDLQFFVP